ncbi:hypothetical protein [Psychroserpens ponticola]|uniref:Outer membrane protein beta-barrel domain-containing protein n=1 Tax=Psychroserpens ponticola TaxID=2932268 RepID=A0ABY7S181_9FLAO|nr:hypothetical protein [Psychroserpens ponticola]WCO03149.1 hypothetical protein MUN68_006550 [Psychroserpens ponticola]
MKTKIIIAFSMVALLLSSTITYAQKKDDDTTNSREGFLFEIGLGGGIISIEDSEGMQTFDVAQGGISFPELKVGYMLNKKLAITAVMPGMIYEFQNNDRHFGGFIPSVQYWVKDKWWIHGGVGLAIDAPALYDISDSNDDWNFGCSIMASTGYDIYKKRDFSINIQSKLLLGRAFLEGDAHRDAVSFSVGIGFSWL